MAEKDKDKIDEQEQVESPDTSEVNDVDDEDVVSDDAPDETAPVAEEPDASEVNDVDDEDVVSDDTSDETAPVAEEPDASEINDVDDEDVASGDAPDETSPVAEEPDTSEENDVGDENMASGDTPVEVASVAEKSEPEFESLSSETQRIINSASKPRKDYSRFQLMVMVNVAILGAIICFLVVKRQPSTSGPVVALAQSPAQETVLIQPVSQNNPESTATDNSSPISQMPANWTVTEKEAEILDEDVSLRTAKQFCKQQDYQKAYYIYKKLQNGLLGDGLKEQCLRDWLSLQMARCLQNSNDHAMMDELFTQVLNSKSVVLQAMANYHIAMIQRKNRQYYESYGRIYRTLSLLKAFEGSMPATMEADCYYMAAESLTRHILRMNNSTSDLPSSFSMDHIETFELPVENPDQLAELLMAGIEEVNNAALMAKVEFYPNRKIGMRWTLTCLKAPVEQILWQFASESDLSVNWEGKKQGFNNRKITAFLPFVDRHYLAEVIAASAGLIWQYDGRSGSIYDPANYSDFDELRRILVQEAVSMWQRFLIRYRNNPKIPNAQFCLGRLYTVSDEKPMALGVYKLVSTQFERDALAAHALFNMAMIKTDMRDYKGAREDLNELLIRYPDCLVVNEALLHLAEVLMKSGLYAESAQIYDRVFHLDLNTEARREALFGSGRCSYETGDYETAAKWLSKAIEMTSDKSDERIGPAYFMLGQAYIALKQHTQASGTLRMALGATLDNHEYAQTIIELSKIECQQENYLQALNVLESIRQERLNQEDSCQVLIAKTNVYKSVGLLDAATSLLRRQIEYVAESSLRAQLSLELAHCYLLNDDLRIAKKELNEAMYDLPVGYDSQYAGYLLAQISFQQSEYQKAKQLCMQNLETNIEDEDLRGQIYHLLGEVYTKQQDYHNAALAFAGTLNQDAL